LVSNSSFPQEVNFSHATHFFAAAEADAAGTAADAEGADSAETAAVAVADASTCGAAETAAEADAAASSFDFSDSVQLRRLANITKLTFLKLNIFYS
jgi:hypothetical protein